MFEYALKYLSLALSFRAALPTVIKYCIKLSFETTNDQKFRINVLSDN